MLNPYRRALNDFQAELLSGSKPPPSLPPTIERYPRTPSDVFHVTFVLRQLLIRDLIPDILDRAEYWPRILIVETNEHRVATEHEAGQIYLVTPIPRGLPPRSLRRVTFTVTSRDQGHSWDSKWHGTYEHSWTWFNVVIFQRDAYVPTKECTDRERVITNVHAGKEYKTHTITWSRDSEDPEQRKAVRELKDETYVGISAWARFRGWHNDIANARIEFEVAVANRG